MNSIHPIILDILKSRDVTSEADLQEFLSEKPKLTYDPYLLHNMKEGVDLILKTIDEGKKICIYGDYDADGVTATSLMLEFLGHMTDNLVYHIPSRFDEGYGLSSAALDKIKEEGTSLVITVDCGSVSFDEVEHAKTIGLQVLVTDHHSLNDRPAECLMINPKQSICKYPYKNLSGCGVAFKLAQAIQRAVDLPKAYINDLLDLVSIATVGDIVSLLGENRTLVKYGLALCNRGKRPGLAALVRGTGLKLGELNSESIAYVIVPHLNAAGRMENADVGVKLLTGTDETNIKKNVDILLGNNLERKSIQEGTYQKCMDIAETFHKDDLFLLIDAEDAHEGITGIVAGKIKDVYRRPTVIFTKTVSPKMENEETVLKGTGRSIESINLYELLGRHEELYEKFGGHSGACGLSMRAENLSVLRELLNADMKDLLAEDPDLFLLKLKNDGSLQFEDLDEYFVNTLWKLAPFGHENHKPRLMFKDMELRNISLLGAKGQHAKFSISKPSKNFEHENFSGEQSKIEKSIGCILFNQAAEYDDVLKEFERVNLIGLPEINSFRGKRSIQIKVEAIER